MAKLEVHVVSPEKEIWTGEADMVVAKGTDGDVGIMPGHAPMLVSLTVAPVRVLDEGDERKVLVDGGYLHVTPGDESTRVDVLAERADLPEETDVAAAKARVEELQPRAQEDAGVRVELTKARMRAEHGLA